MLYRNLKQKEKPIIILLSSEIIILIMIYISTNEIFFPSVLAFIGINIILVCDNIKCTCCKIIYGNVAVIDDKLYFYCRNHFHEKYDISTSNECILKNPGAIIPHKCKYSVVSHILG